MRTPAPARRVVWIVISFSWLGSAVGVDHRSRAGAYRGRRVHRPSPGRKGPASAVGVDPATDAGAKPRGGLHLRLPSAEGVDDGAAARPDGGARLHRPSPVEGSAVGIHDAPHAGAEGGARLHRPSPGGTYPPLGSMADPAPARTWVMVLISASVQPSGSMKEPPPARIVVLVVMVRLRSRGVASAVGVHDGPATGADVGDGAHLRLRSTEGVDEGAGAGVDRGRGAHRSSPSKVACQPLGSMPGPLPARRVVLVRMVRLPSRVAAISRWGRCPSRCRRRGWWSSACCCSVRRWRERAAELPCLHRVRRSMRGCLCRVCDRPRRTRAAGVEP
jgi:hypothetical protein